MATYEEEMLKKAQLQSEQGQNAQQQQPAQGASTAQQTQNSLMQTAASQNVMSAQQYLDALVKGEKPQYQTSYAPQIQELYDKVMNRGNFKYDVNADPLYQQLRAEQMNSGRLAMEDTIAQATGLSGGYGNSFAQAAGQQQYNQYIQQLTGQIPELRNQARQEWAEEGDALQNQLAMAQQMDAQEYEKFRTEVSDLWNNMQFDYQKEQDALAEQWNQKNYQLQQQQLAQQAAYQQQQLALQQQQLAAQQAAQQWQQQMAEKEYASGLEYQQWQQQMADRESAFDQALGMIQAGMTPSESLMGMAGITAEDVAAYKNMLKGSGGGGGSSSGSKPVSGGAATTTQPNYSPYVYQGQPMLKDYMETQSTLGGNGGNNEGYTDDDILKGFYEEEDKFKKYMLK